MENMYFALNVNNKYINQASVTITSVVLNLNPKYFPTFYILIKDCDNKPIQFVELEKKYNLNIVIINLNKHLYLLDKIDLRNHPSPEKTAIILQRLLVFKILPEKIDKIIFMDADMIADGDLSIPYNNFKSDKLFASVVDIFVLKHKKKFFKKYINFPEYKKWCENPTKYAYFNNGFFIANLKMCKKLNIFEQFIEFCSIYPDIDLLDQDAANSIFAFKYSDKIEYLHPKYNLYADANVYRYNSNTKYFYSKVELKEAFKNPIVIHFAGPIIKPWNNNFALNYTKTWRKYCKLSTAKFDKLPRYTWPIYHLLRKFIY